jgi:hypothetical protein
MIYGQNVGALSRDVFPANDHKAAKYPLNDSDEKVRHPKSPHGLHYNRINTRVNAGGAM